MISGRIPFLLLFTLRNICCGYFLESPGLGNSNKYPQQIFLGVVKAILTNIHNIMFLGVLNTVSLNISNYLSHLKIRNHSIQIVVITNFVVISNASIKRFDCTCFAPGLVAQSDACSTGDQEGVNSRLRSGNILSLRLIMKSFLRSFSPFRWFKKGSYQLLAKECALSTG